MRAEDEFTVAIAKMLATRMAGSGGFRMDTDCFDADVRNERELMWLARVVGRVVNDLIPQGAAL